MRDATPHSPIRNARPWLTRLSRGDRAEAFTLVEILVVVFLLALALVPILNAFSPAAGAGKESEKTLVFVNQARATLNQLLALDFAALDSYRINPVGLTALLSGAGVPSDQSFQFQGVTYQPAATVADASGGLGGLLQLTVTAGDVSLTTFKAEY